MDKNLFDDLMASCNEVLAYGRGEIQHVDELLQIADE